nr:GAF domain-containing protein [Nesterenkonia sp. DZ6]
MVRSNHFLTDQHGLLSLLQASQLVTGDLDLDQVLHNLAESARTLVDARFGALGVVDDHGTMERFIHVGMSPELVKQMGSPPRGLGVLGAVLTGGAPIRLRNLTEDPRSVGAPLAHPAMKAFLGVPITIRGSTYGALYLTNPSEKAFTSHDEALVKALAATAATAIDNARVYERSRRAQELSAALSEVAAKLLAAEGGEVFGVLAESVVSLTGAQLVSVVVSEAVGRDFYVHTARGDRATQIECSSVPWMDCVLARAMDGEPGITPEGGDEPVPFADDIPSASMVAVPLVVDGDRVAALCATRSADESPFTDDDLELLEEFAAQAGLAIALAWARADRQRLEIVDERARIAQDLHDHVIQRLFGTGLGLEALASAHPQLSDSIETHVTQIDAAIGDIRTAIFTLQTRTGAEATRHRLLRILTELSDTLSAQPRITFVGTIDLIIVGSLADDVAAALRETLCNVARHADATTIEVEITATPHTVTLRVDDDGVGLSSDTSRRSGTDNLRARARAHGGDFTLSPRGAGGTRALWWAPVKSPGLP